MTVQVVFGASAEGCLKVAMGIRPDKSVLNWEDDLMSGPPVCAASHDWEDVRLRWGEAIANEEARQYLPYLRSCMEAWREWLPRLSMDPVPVVIWAADNVFEQTGLRAVLASLPPDVSVSVMDVTVASGGRFRHTGEASPEELALWIGKAEPLAPRTKDWLIQDWRRLVQEAGLLRIYKNGSLRTVDESYFDETIIRCIRTIQAEAQGWVKIGPLIGEILFHALDRPISHSWIEYRLRRLIEQGILTYTGSLEAMHDYVVKLVEPPDSAG
ncbi:DUF3658 domain-containing protein [Paenibacillus ehimensis]|uniref:DUF3658 domain-containing protein n=1 Tax=Paenibacillus ehimensis TaxID=79264 RepID=UPI002DBB9142|nr:DUF3658 domain-containing protein [Paenibacillus ehimensis]MEC0212424.1 DUF3658 domain-containing protein [Paenibacillus ehimensis]